MPARTRVRTWGVLELARRTRGAGASRVPGVARAGGAALRGDRVARTVGAGAAACLHVFTCKGVWCGILLKTSSYGDMSMPALHTSIDGEQARVCSPCINTYDIREYLDTYNATRAHPAPRCVVISRDMGAREQGFVLAPRTSTLLHEPWDVLVGPGGAGGAGAAVGARVTRVAGAGGAALRRIGVVRTRSTSIRTRESHQSVRACQIPGVVISTRVSCARRNRQGARNTCWTGRAGAAHRTSVAGLAVQVLWRRAKTQRGRE